MAGASFKEGGKKSTYKKNTGAAGSKRKFDKHTEISGTPANKKRALKHERQSHRKHAAAVRSAKEIWNELRVKTNDKDTNTKLCNELFGLLEGKCMETCMQHDASRCVQGVIQYGTEQQRRAVVTELCESKQDDSNNGQQNLGELCKIQYAHFVVLKIIKYCFRDAECVKMVVRVSELNTTSAPRGRRHLHPHPGSEETDDQAGSPFSWLQGR